MNQTELTLEEIQAAFSDLRAGLDLDAKKNKLKELQQQSTQSRFWDNDVQAREIMQEIAQLEHQISQVESFTNKLTQLVDLEAIVNDSDDDSLSRELASEKRKLAKEFQAIKTETYLSGKYDRHPAIISIHAGQGGTEAMDWASMLQRMYMRYFERQNFKYQIVEISQGEEAGIKSVTFTVRGTFAYGYLKGESGTHRLVRLSPFNADNLRQTSFAGVEVTPLLQGTKGVTIKDEDLEWQFYRSGGSGGQNVNKVNTAVRVKHKPSGIVVSSQAERTQIRNREIALEILESKLEKIKEEKEQTQANRLKGEHKVAGWGNQIRNYVLHPYQMIKDVRTGVETSNSEAVLDGDLQDFIEAEVALLATE